MPRYFTNPVPEWLMLLEKIQNELNTFGFTVEEILEEGLDGKHSQGSDSVSIEKMGSCLTEDLRRKQVRQSLSLMVKKELALRPEKGSDEYSLTDRGRDIDVTRLMEMS